MKDSATHEERNLAKRLRAAKKTGEYEKFLIGDFIRQLRSESELTQLMLAIELNTTQSAIARIEAGKQNLSVSLLARIAKIFKKNLHIYFD